MTQLRGVLRPQTFQKKVKTLKVRLVVKAIPAGAATQVADVMLQAGATVTGWSPHVTELPWSQGVVGG